MYVKSKEEFIARGWPGKPRAGEREEDKGKVGSGGGKNMATDSTRERRKKIWMVLESRGGKGAEERKKCDDSLRAVR
jgi:hypothetical protein